MHVAGRAVVWLDGDPRDATIGLGGGQMRIRVLMAFLALTLSCATPALSKVYEDRTDCDAVQRLAESGEAAFYVELAICHLRGEGRDSDVAKGLFWLRKAVAGGDTDAMVELGNLYLFGAEGLPSDRRAAVTLYTHGARLGDPNAMYNLAVMYRGGKGLPEKPKLARAWYLRSAEDGSAAGAFGAGIALLEGYGGRVEAKRGVLMLRRAIEMGSAEAMNELGRLHAQGSRVPSNPDEAIYLFEAAARNDLAAGMFSLGAAHYNGRLTAKNYVEAMRWFQQAADRGDLDAWYALGVMCEYGRGMHSDTDLALQMYHRAAESADDALREKAQQAIHRLEGLDDDEDGPIG